MSGAPAGEVGESCTGDENEITENLKEPDAKGKADCQEPLKEDHTTTEDSKQVNANDIGQDSTGNENECTEDLNEPNTILEHEAQRPLRADHNEMDDEQSDTPLTGSKLCSAEKNIEVDVAPTIDKSEFSVEKHDKDKANKNVTLICDNDVTVAFSSRKPSNADTECANVGSNTREGPNLQDVVCSMQVDCEEDGQAIYNPDNSIVHPIDNGNSDPTANETSRVKDAESGSILTEASESKDESFAKDLESQEDSKACNPDHSTVHPIDVEQPAPAVPIDTSVTDTLPTSNLPRITEEIPDEPASESPMVKPPTIPSFTQDPLDIETPTGHSLIGTPAESNNSNSPPSDEVTDPTIFLAPEFNPLAPFTRSSNSPPTPYPCSEAKELEKFFSEDNTRKEERIKTPPPTRRGFKKNVSIVSPTAPVKEKLLGRPMEQRDRSPTSDSQTTYNERTPLLACSSLPTVVGDDQQYGQYGDEYPGPSTSTRSEIGRDEMRKKRKRSKRKRSAPDQRTLQRVNKTRPLIVSPFMPIPTQLSVDLDRRSVVGRDGTRRVGPSGVYGSTAGRRVEEGLLQKAPDENSEEDEDEASSSDESSSEAVEVLKGSFSSLTHKEWATIVMLCLANLCSTVAFSCIAPFYPTEAKMKGMSETQTGMVFGVFELVMFLTAPVFGKYMVSIGSKRMFNMGLATTAFTAVLFGFLNYIPSGDLFFWMSLLIRIVEAVGDAAFVTSSFAISAKCFPGRIAFVVGLLETFAGLGYTAGPLIGGVLYEFGGFQTPFIALGVILFIASGLSFWLIEHQDESDDSEDGLSMSELLRIPVIWLMVYAIVVCAISLSFLDPTLAGHLESFKLSPTMVGLMFLLCGGIYTLSAPLWGLLIDRFHCMVAIMLFGSVTTVISMFLIGPSPFLPWIQKDLIVIGLALVLLGVAAGALYIPTFQNCLDAVKEHGYEDNFHTYGCVSGVFQSAFAFGAFFGPTVGSFTTERIGFAWTTTIIGFVHVLFILTVIVFYGSSSCIQRSRLRV